MAGWFGNFTCPDFARKAAGSSNTGAGLASFAAVTKDNALNFAHSTDVLHHAYTSARTHTHTRGLIAHTVTSKLIILLRGPHTQARKIHRAKEKRKCAPSHTAARRRFQDYAGENERERSTHRLAACVGAGAEEEEGSWSMGRGDGES